MYARLRIYNTYYTRTEEFDRNRRFIIAVVLYFSLSFVYTYSDSLVDVDVFVVVRILMWGDKTSATVKSLHPRRNRQTGGKHVRQFVTLQLYMHLCEHSITAPGYIQKRFKISVYMLHIIKGTTVSCYRSLMQSFCVWYERWTSTCDGVLQRTTFTILVIKNPHMGQTHAHCPLIIYSL